MGVLFLGVDASQELQHAECPDEVVSLLVVEEVGALAFLAHPGAFADDQGCFHSPFFVVDDAVLDGPEDVGGPGEAFVDLAGKVRPAQRTDGEGGTELNGLAGTLSGRRVEGFSIPNKIFMSSLSSEALTRKNDVMQGKARS